jgi:hypothetical protein
MSKHTPGPWIVYEFVDGYDIRAPEAECYVATASDPEAVWGAIGREEDACLIAAAPDLLEALENLLKVHEGEGGTQHNAVDMARAVIAKAKGEE